MPNNNRTNTTDPQVAADDNADCRDGIDLFSGDDWMARHYLATVNATRWQIRYQVLEDFLMRVLPEDETVFGIRDAANLLDLPQTHLIALLLKRGIAYRTQGEPGGPANPKGNDRRLRPYSKAIRAGKAKVVLAPDRHAKGGKGFPQAALAAVYLKSLLAEDRAALRAEAAAAADWYADARHDGLHDLCETTNGAGFGTFRRGGDDNA